MPSRNDKQIFVTEEAFEVRYEPRGSFLTHIGEIADYIRDKKLFTNWQIDTNTITFKDAPTEPEHLHAFMSYRNAGLVATDTPTANFFTDKACQYWKAIENNKIFIIPKVSRIGVRNRCFVRIDKEFSAIENSMFNYFFKPNIQSTMNGTRKDLQVILKFVDGETRTSATFGPLTKNEAKRLFSFKSEHFEHSGVFIDLDTSIENPTGGYKAVDSFIRKSSQDSWQRIEQFLKDMGL